ncbi:NAD(P)H-hydrate dehydratase [Thermomonas flagellata]|uniref:NAD(P)H-hydrate dehydratase n=1 Tax=Thermomonas flagellata TaxID=2888524 RepID=UPI001F04375E|nr:NAD(P)H-hydrate dehydratase [Thermomonas flagellata]
MHSPVPLHDSAGVRALEARAISDAGGDPGVLMERAGQAGWRHVLAHWPQAGRIAVVCGPGNNGGDGYVLARHAHVAGRVVQALAAAEPRSAPARAAREAYAAAGGAFAEALGEADLIVDALFGIGLTRAPEPAHAALIAAINAHPAPVLALDVPSGIDAGRGSAPGAAVRAARTLQFLARHRGLYTGPALDHVGQIALDTLAVPPAVLEAVPPAALGYAADALAGFLPPRARDSHKGRYGHVLCIGGDAGGGGAIALAAEAAHRVGAGLVSVATRGLHVPGLLARRPETMAHAVAEVADLLPALERASVLAIGPGLGQAAWGHALLAASLGQPLPKVLDADALNLLAANAWPVAPGDVLTPHPGEAARLLGTTVAEVQRDRFAAAAALQARYGCSVVLKGAGSVVVAAGQLPAVVCAGNPGMASGGIGDLLAGAIAGLLAQGLAPAQAALAGTLLHAAAGDAAAAEGGPRGLLATDLLPWLRRLANPEPRA